MAAMAKISQKAGKHHAHVRTGTKSETGVCIKDLLGSITLFYRNAAAKVQDPVARTTFLRIADEEQSQAEGINPCSGAGIRTQAENRAIRRMVSAFEEIEGSILKKIGKATDEVGALKIAMEMEMESIRLYAKLLPKIQAPGLKTLVWRLLREEQQRYTTLENTCLYLSDPAGWYLWNEQGITDGGTPWA